MSATDILHLPSVNARTLNHTYTRHNADVVHALPNRASSLAYSGLPTASSLVAVGNYELQPASGAKVGGIALYEVDAAAGRLVERSYLATSAVFDLQWRDGPLADRPLLACADAAGAVSVLQLTRDGDECALSSVAQLDVYGGSGASCLSVDWDDGRLTTATPATSATSQSSTASIACSSSAGDVSVLALGPSSSTLSVLASCTPHSLEVWSCAYSAQVSSSLYSGGDDCLLCHTDTRAMQPAVLSRLHTAGVCCVLPSASSPHLLATGCYDELVRVWDTRAWRRPLGEKRLNGGVWRLRWGRTDSGEEDASRLLCCCMHAGVQLVEVAEGGAALRVVSEYYEHQSLAYGGDWVTVQQSAADGTGERNNAVVSCSFYDNSLRLWLPDSADGTVAVDASVKYKQTA